LTENHLFKTFLIDASSLIAGASNVCFDDDDDDHDAKLEEYISTVISPQFAVIAMFLAKHLGDIIDFSIIDNIVFMGRIAGEGLNKLIKPLLSVMEAGENEDEDQ
jgi:hypothetical protein